MKLCGCFPRKSKVHAYGGDDQRRYSSSARTPEVLEKGHSPSSASKQAVELGEILGVFSRHASPEESGHVMPAAVMLDVGLLEPVKPPSEEDEKKGAPPEVKARGVNARIARLIKVRPAQKGRSIFSSREPSPTTTQVAENQATALFWLRGQTHTPTSLSEKSESEVLVQMLLKNI